MQSRPIEFYIYSCVSEKFEDQWRLCELRGPIDKVRLAPLADAEEAACVLDNLHYFHADCEVRIAQTNLVATSQGDEFEAHQFLMCHKTSGKPLMVIDARRRSAIANV